MAKTVPPRSAIDPAYKWKLETIYPSDEAWEAEYRHVEDALPRLAAFAGHLAEDGMTLLNCLRLRDDVFLRMGKLYAYAHMRKDEDATVDRYDALFAKAIALYARCQTSVSFLEPEIVALEDATLERFLAETRDLQLYRRYFEQVRRLRDHVRSPEVEELLARLTEVGTAPSNIYHMLADADLKLPVIRDENGEEVQLSSGRYLQFLQSKQRDVRRAAYEGMLGTYRDFAHTIAAVYTTQLKADAFYAQARRYPSTLEMALSQSEIPLPVYQNLIDTVHGYVPALQRYLDLRRRILGLDQLRMYDLYVPIVPNPPSDISWEKAREMVVEALRVLGEDYSDEVRRGLTQEGWVDVFENQGKRSGAYSSGSYGTQPFILMNYDGTLENVYTLAHELGHSMHSLYTRRHQPFVYGDYTIFVAEVASTLNETLLSRYLLERAEDADLRLYVLNHDLEHVRTTLFRQTLFAEFEAKAHEMVARGVPTTAETLTELYRSINHTYYSPAVEIDELIGYEWARIPHFYSSFYVYQYATGISAASALAQMIAEEGRPAVERYRTFLTLGSSQPPIDLLRTAGVDMTSPEPIKRTLEAFSKKVEEMEALLTRED